MKIVVLGASGQIGSVIFKGLKNFYDVIGTSRKHRNPFTQFDPFNDNWSSLGKPDVLINCIGQIESTTESSFYHIHVELTNQILKYRMELGNPRIIQVSALGASSKHEIEFLKTKGIADDLLLEHPNTAVIRPSIVCTHRTMLVRKMLMLSKLSRIMFGAVLVPKGFLTTRIQPIMPEDLVELIQKMCIVKKSRMLDAVGSDVLTFDEILEILTKRGNRRFKIVEVPKVTTDVVVKNILGRLVPGIINVQQYQLLFQDNTASVESCRQLLDRTPMSTREFFEREFACEQSQQPT
jgi:dTDP-4-dehydrorhamnose reductase